MRAGIFTIRGLAWLVRAPLVLLTLAPALANAAAAPPPMHIQFAEAVGLPATAGKAEFDAYGRRFSITLESNERLLASLPVTHKAQLGQTRVLRGKVDGAPRSWIRLTRVGNHLEGAIWDGREMYVVSNYAGIAKNLTTPLAAQPDQTVVYRLSDTQGGLPPEFCGLEGTGAASTSKAGAASSSKTTALTQYQDMVSDLQSKAGGVADSLDISLIADRQFQDANGADSAAAMLARLNVVEGIFTEQVGVILMPTEFRLMQPGSDPLTATDATELLGQLATYRERTPAVSSAGLAHLLTGKDLDGIILGIAYLDALCDEQLGVSLSDSEQGPFMSALVMAHELGHNFGARHDGVASFCSATPQTYLMAPELNGSAQFSQCSLASMTASIASARGRCIAPAQYVDLQLQLPQSPYAAQTNGTFSLPLTVQSVGNLLATQVQLQITFPPWFQLSGVTLAGSTCTATNNNVVTCPLADVPAGEARALDLRVTAVSTGIYSVKALVLANNDLVTANNGGEFQLGVQSGVDLGVTVSPSATAVFVTDPVDYTIDITSRGTLASNGGTLEVSTGGIPVESIDDGPHSCAMQPGYNWILLCQLADMAPGATTRIVVHARPDQARIANGGVYLNVRNDSTRANDEATMSVAVSAEREVRTTVSAEELRAVIGTNYELTYTLTTLGRLPAQNVRFALQHPNGGVVDSVTTAVTCAPAGEFTNCDLGTLNPGDVRTVTVRFHMTSAVTSSISASSRWSDGVTNAFSSTYTWIYSNLTIDVAAVASDRIPVDEDATGTGAFSVETRGVNPAQGVAATVELAAPLRLLSIYMYNGTPGWTCTLLTTQRGRCTGSFNGGTLFTDTTAVVGYTYVSATAGNGLATVAVSATDDGDPTNNAGQSVLPIRPYVDIGISGATATRVMVVGQTTTVTATLTTGKNPVPNAQLLPWASDGSLALDSLTVGGVDCSQTPSGGVCALGTLPANASIPVSGVFRAVTGGGMPYAVLDVLPNIDSNNSNNHFALPIQTLGPSDITVTALRSSATGTNGTLLYLPRITVFNDAALTRQLTVDIPIPSFAAVNSVSSDGGVCTGTTTLQCFFSGIAANNTASIDIVLTPSGTGTFTSNVEVKAVNDSTPANNTVAIELTVNSATTPTSPNPLPPPSGGGSSGGGSSSGGGGGRVEWLLIALLGGLVWRRQRRLTPSRSNGGRRHRASPH